MTYFNEVITINNFCRKYFKEWDESYNRKVLTLIWEELGLRDCKYNVITDKVDSTGFPIISGPKRLKDVKSILLLEIRVKKCRECQNILKKGQKKYCSRSCSGKSIGTENLQIWANRNNLDCYEEFREDEEMEETYSLESNFN